MTPDNKTLKLVATITLENSRQIEILLKACASLVQLATPLLSQRQPSVKTEIAVQLADLEHALSRAVRSEPSLEMLSRELGLDLPPAD